MATLQIIGKVVRTTGNWALLWGLTGAAAGPVMTLLRIDPKLWAELEAWAQDELRSVNGQVEYLLRQAGQKRKGNQRPSNTQSTKQPTTKS